MVLWVSLCAALALLTTAAAVAVAMIQAERRARRRLYRALGLGDDTVELLMARGGDVLTELSLLRMSPKARDAAVSAVDAGPSEEQDLPVRQEASHRVTPAVRQTRPSEGRLTAAPRRRPYSGRRRG